MFWAQMTVFKEVLTMARDGYRWQNPHEWLMWRIDSLNLDDPTDVEQLKAIAKLVATDLDADQIEDAFPVAMGVDNYYEQWFVCPSVEGACLDEGCRHAEPHIQDPFCEDGGEYCSPCRVARTDEVPR